jgi:hypothetical protein
MDSSKLDRYQQNIKGEENSKEKTNSKEKRVHIICSTHYNAETITAQQGTALET